MHLREKVLGLARLHLMRGEPIPADLLAEADSLGLLLSAFDQPTNTTTTTPSKESLKWQMQELTTSPTRGEPSTRG